MAKTASSENIQRDEDGPDYDKTILAVRGQLRANDADQKKLAQENSTVYKRIEKEYGVHSGAAKQFAAIDKMAAEKRSDFLRSLLGLLNRAGYNDFDDLVDRAQRPKTEGETKTSASVPDALDGEPTVDLKTGMLVGSDGSDIREATPDEMAAARNKQADFDDGDGKVHRLKPGIKAN